MADAIFVGSRFSSYEELEKAIHEYETEKKASFYKRESKTLQNVSLKLKNFDKARPELKYYMLKYTCIAGGKTHKKRCTDDSRQSKTFRQNCPAFIHLLLSADKQYLEIKSRNEDHDHALSESLFRSLPKERRLPAEYQEKVQKYMNLQVNKKLLQEEIVRETGKNVTLKDLSNIAAKGRKASNDFDEILDALQNVYHCSVSLLKEDDTLQGIFFQDKEMKDMYNSYPEILFFDGTYKLIDNNFTCYIYLIEDGNGYSEIIGVGLLAREDKESVQWLIRTFKQTNDKCHETRVIVTDKDFTERVVFKDLFPSAHLEICLFHTLKSFKREITPEKMGVSKEVCDTAKEFLTKLAYCQSEESYLLLYQSFQSVAPSSILKYYNDNWHDLRKEWTYMSCANGNFLNMTNNRLECINGKLKTVIRKFSSFSAFIKSLFAVIYSMRKERNHLTATAVLKVSSTKFPAGSAEELYSNLLNPYPFGMLLRQITMSKDPKQTSAEGSNFSYEHEGKSYPTSAISCHCLWFNSMKLPCRHILSVRRKLLIPTFDQTLCDKRWHKSHLESVHRVFNARSMEFENCCTQEEKPIYVPKTTTARYSHLLPLVQKVAAVAAESTGSEFLEKEAFLKLLLNKWEKGQTVSLCAAEPMENADNILIDHDYGCSAAVDTQIGSAVRDIGTQFTGVSEPGTSGIRLPAPVKRKGRPAGLTSTVIGLKRKKTTRPIPFSKKAPLDRQKMLLGCFVDEVITSRALTEGILIEEDAIECCVEKVSSVCMEPCVEMNEVKRFFTSEGWLQIQNVITTKSRMMTWECDSCKQDCGHGSTISCDSCLHWYHYSCVGLLQPPKQKYWFCRKCNV